LGEPGCGKTEILRTIAPPVSDSDMKATVGVDFYTKYYELEGNLTVIAQFWDIAGQERFDHLTVCSAPFSSSSVPHSFCESHLLAVLLSLLIANVLSGIIWSHDCL